MEHFHHAGGVPKLMAQLGDLIDLDANHHGPNAARYRCRRREVPGRTPSVRATIRSSEARWRCCTAILAARRVIKHSAASPKLLQHTGRAVVFDPSRTDPAGRRSRSRRQRRRRTGVAHAGPKGAPGMPEAGYLPIPKKLARGGVRTWCGYRMRAGGTAFGTIVAHHPESAVGGPLALVRTAT
jgi:dihydroxy-acid dehydratase